MVREHLTRRALRFNLVLDDVSITHVAFSPEFTHAVEAKQVAQQTALRAAFLVDQAVQEKLVMSCSLWLSTLLNSIDSRLLCVLRERHKVPSSSETPCAKTRVSSSCAAWRLREKLRPSFRHPGTRSCWTLPVCCSTVRESAYAQAI